MKKALVLGLIAVGALAVVGAFYPSKAAASGVNVLTQGKRMDVRSALKALFRKNEGSYILAPDVKGAVMVDIDGQPFEKVLQSICDQVHATFKVEGGVYNIYLKR